jgi:hypothetical protein
MFFIALISVLVILAIKLLYNHLAYTDAPLGIVNNKEVELKIVSKYLFNFKMSEVTKYSSFNTTNIKNATIVKTTPSKSGNFKGINRIVYLYNQGPSAFVIKGISYFARPKVTSPSKTIISVKRMHGDAEDSSDYTGGPVEILPEEELEFSGIDEYIVSRLLIITDNAEPRNITVVVFDKTTNLYSCVTISEFDKIFLFIDFYE